MRYVLDVPIIDIEMSKVQGDFVPKKTLQDLVEEALGKAGLEDLDALYLIVEGNGVNDYLEKEIKQPSPNLESSSDLEVKIDPDVESMLRIPEVLDDLESYNQPALLVYERNTPNRFSIESLKAILQCDTAPWLNRMKELSTFMLKERYDLECWGEKIDPDFVSPELIDRNLHPIRTVTLIRLLCSAGFGPSKGFAYNVVEEHYFDYLEYGETAEVFASLSISSMDMPEEQRPEIRDLGDPLYCCDSPVLVVYDMSKLEVLSPVEGYKDCFKVKCKGVDNLMNAVVATVVDYGDPKYNAFVEELIEKFQRGCTGEKVSFEYDDVPDVQCKNHCMIISTYLNDALKLARETEGFPKVEGINNGTNLRKISEILIEYEPSFGPYPLYVGLVTGRSITRDNYAHEEED